MLEAITNSSIRLKWWFSLRLIHLMVLSLSQDLAQLFLLLVNICSQVSWTLPRASPNLRSFKRRKLSLSQIPRRIHLKLQRPRVQRAQALAKNHCQCPERFQNQHQLQSKMSLSMELISRSLSCLQFCRSNFLEKNRISLLVATASTKSRSSLTTSTRKKWSTDTTSNTFEKITYWLSLQFSTWTNSIT